MQKILSLTLSIILFIFLLFLGTGYAVGGYYNGEYEFVIQEKQSEVWDILIDYQNYNKARKGVDSIETTGNYGDLFSWRENLENGGFRKYRQIKKENNNRLIIEMTESSYGMTGKWEFLLFEKDDQTFIKIKETSNIDSILRAGYMYYFSRNKETLDWVKLIKLRILGRLISTA